MTKAKSAGERFAEEIRSRFVLEPAEEVLLRQAADVLDYCVQLQAELNAGSPLMKTKAGVRAHPAAVELRAQRLCLARLIGAMKIPEVPAAAAGRHLERVS